MNSLRLRAYGKINLALDVVRKREDGYHEVRMIMQTVKVYDRIWIRRALVPGIRIRTNLPYLPTNENNLVYKAAKLLMDEAGIKDGLQIDLRKYIPVAAAMAGGSSDAAAVLYGVNRMFGLSLSKRRADAAWAYAGGGCSVLSDAWDSAGGRNRGKADAAAGPPPGICVDCEAVRQCFHEICL